MTSRCIRPNCDPGLARERFPVGFQSLRSTRKSISMSEYNVSGTVLACVAIAVLLVSVVVVRLVWKKKDPKLAQFPPLRGKTWRENARTITTIKDAAGLHFLNDICKKLEAEELNGQDGSGVVFRLAMPQSAPFIICTDYKVAHMILEGDSAHDVSESEKTSLVRQFDLFHNRPSLFSDQTSSADRHASRKFIAAAFSMKNLAYTFGVVYENLLTGSRVIDRKIQQKQTLDLGEFMLRLTFDTITQSSFDAKLSTLLDEDPNSTADGPQYMTQQDTFLRVISANLLNPLKKFMFWSADNKAAEASRVFKRDMATRLIDSYRAAHAGEDLEKDNSIMGHLLRNKYRDERDRLSDMMVFISAGHETTSWSLTWLILEISRHPEVKQKLLDELDRNIPPRPSADHAASAETAFPSISKLSSLPYLSMCIKESMRLWPVAASGPRRITLQNFDFRTNAAALDVSLPTVHIPKGSTVQVNFFSMFRAGWIDRADEFVPERWGAENPQLPQLKEMFMPFSVGRRNCIGQNLANVELVMIAAYMLRYYDFKLVSEPQQELFLSFKAKDVLMEVQHRP